MVGIRRTVAPLCGSLLLAFAVELLTVANAQAATSSGATNEYELVCTGSPTGTAVYNNVVTSATLSPVQPAAGQQFSVDGYQTKIPIPSSWVSTVAAVQSTFSGTARFTVNAVGATPGSMSVPSGSFSQPITSSSSSLTVTVPTSPQTVGPFVSSGGALNITQSQSSTLTIDLGSKTLNQSCTSYPNNANDPANGVLTGSPSGSPTSPVLVAATNSGSSASSSTTAAPPTTTPPATTAPTSSASQTPATAATPADAAAPSSLADTGPSSRLLTLAAIGGMFVVMALLLAIFEMWRRRWIRGLHRVKGRSP